MPEVKNLRQMMCDVLGITHEQSQVDPRLRFTEVPGFDDVQFETRSGIFKILAFYPTKSSPQGGLSISYQGALIVGHASTQDAQIVGNFDFDGWLRVLSFIVSKELIAPKAAEVVQSPA